MKKHFFIMKDIFEGFFCDFIYIFSIGKSYLEHSVGAMGRCACPGDRVVLEISGCGPMCAGSDIPAGRAPGPSENP